MDEDARRREIAKKTIVYEIPGMYAVTRREVEYGRTDDGPLTMDVYLPPGATPGQRHATVIFVFGFAHPQFASGLRMMGMYVSWAKLLAASGIAAVAYGYRDPVADLDAVLRHVREHAGDLGIDERRIGLFAASGNVPAALSLLMREPPDAFRCAALWYGYTLDLGDSTRVAQAASMIGFITPAPERSVDDLPAAVPLFLLRAGRDTTPGLNETLDRFVAAGLARNLPLSLANHPTAPHAFDLFDDTDATRTLIRRAVAFFQDHLGAQRLS